jgi:hypothetical protein
VNGHLAFNNSSMGRASSDPIDADQLDINYFVELSPDALPALVASYRSDAVPGPVKDALGAALACIRYRRADAHPDTDWRSYHASRWEQARLLDSIRSELKGYFIDSDNDNWRTAIFTPLGKEYDCGYTFMD